MHFNNTFFHLFRKTSRKIEKFIILAILYPCIYKLSCILPVRNDKAVFVEIRLDKISDSLILLYRELKEQNYTIHEHHLRSGFVSQKKYIFNCIKYIHDIATAKYIFISDAVNVLGRISLRQETTMVQTWHGCGAFKKFGYSTCELIFGPSRKELEFYPTSNNYSLVTVSSPDVVWAYQEAMGLPRNKVLPLGISRTDVYFQKEFLIKAKYRFYQVIPQAKGKKVILYAPTYRGRVAEAKAPEELSIKALFDNFAGEYVLVIKHHPLVKFIPEIPTEYSEFAFDVTKILDIEFAMISSDICITDYSSLIFEYALLEKPMLFFAFDLDEYCDWRGFYYDYNELTPGPVCSTNQELINYIRKVDINFFREEIAAFRMKFMSACDGDATHRIINYINGGKGL